MAAWVKGQSGNPSGRPKKILPSGKTISEAAIEHAEEALKTLVEIVMNSQASEAARVSAANSLLDRGFGKPTQTLAGDDENPLSLINTIRREVIDKGEVK